MTADARIFGALAFAGVFMMRDGQNGKPNNFAAKIATSCGKAEKGSRRHRR